MQKKIIQMKRRTSANHESNFQFLCWLRFPIDHSLVFELMKQKLTFTSSLLGVQLLDHVRKLVGEVGPQLK